jgi:hypothetical protein
VRLKSTFASAAPPLPISEHEEIKRHYSCLVQNDVTFLYRATLNNTVQQHEHNGLQISSN